MSVNRVILVGNLGADPEIRNTQGGGVVANLRLATSDRRKDRDGNWSDQTEWHRVVLFGKTAEVAQNYLKKGKMVYIEGRIQTNKWTDKDGVERYTTEIIGETMRMLGGRGEGEGGGGYSRGGGGGAGGGGASGGRGGGGRAPASGGGGNYNENPDDGGYGGPDYGGGRGGGGNDDIPF